MKGTQEGFLSRAINPPQRQISAFGRNLPSACQKTLRFFGKLRRPPAEPVDAFLYKKVAKIGNTGIFAVSAGRRDFLHSIYIVNPSFALSPFQKIRGDMFPLQVHFSAAKAGWSGLYGGKIELYRQIKKEECYHGKP